MPCFPSQVFDVEFEPVITFDADLRARDSSCTNETTVTSLHWISSRKALLVGDASNRCIAEFTFPTGAMDGKPTFSRLYKHPSIDNPSGIATIGDLLYVCDAGADCIHVFGSGAWQRSFGSSGDRPGCLSTPKSVSLTK